MFGQIKGGMCGGFKVIPPVTSPLSVNIVAGAISDGGEQSLIGKLVFIFKGQIVELQRFGHHFLGEALRNPMIYHLKIYTKKG